MNRTLACSVLVSLATLAAACGDDAESGGAPTSTAAVTSTAAPGSGASGASGSGATPGSTATPPSTAAPTTTARPAAASAGAVRDTKLALERVVQANAPLVLATRPGSTNLYVAERAGRVRVLTPDRALGAPILDISADVTTDFEKGLLGLAFSPDGTLLYASYTDSSSDTRIDEFRMNGDAVDVASRRIVLQVDQPAGNHNGGNIAFGPDGFLWLGLGDGGGSGDQYRNAQNLDTLLGDFVRIDPLGRGAGAYSIPPDNPYANGGGAPEIWLSGVRNPWRWSFDRVTGDLWIGDVGQNAYEEVDLLPAPGRGRGANLQWPLREGLHRYSGEAPAGSTPPVFEYDRSNGACSITGGFVYRGQALRGLQGAYVYGDYCEGSLFALVANGDRYERISLGVSAGKNALVSFGQDNDGELYVLALSGAISKLVAA